MNNSGSGKLPPMQTSPARRAAAVEDGERLALRCVGSLLTSSLESNQPEVEVMCRNAFNSGINSAKSSALIPPGINTANVSARERDRDRLASPYIPQYTVILARHDASKHGKQQKPEKKGLDLLPTGSLSLSASANQTKNQAIRFGLEEGPTGLLQRQTWAFTGAVSGAKNLFTGSSHVESKDYEEVTNTKILQAPISEICIIQRGEPVPDGFYKLSKTPSNKKANLNAGSGGNHIFLCIKKDLIGDAVPVTSLVVVFPDKNECVPPGFFCVRRGKHACNINTGTSAERIFLCYKKDKSANPITDIQVFFPGKNEDSPKCFNLIDKSPTGLPANLNTGTGGGRVYLSYRQLLSRLECLRIDVIPPTIETSSPNRAHGKRVSSTSRIFVPAAENVQSPKQVSRPNENNDNNNSSSSSNSSNRSTNGGSGTSREVESSIEELSPRKNSDMLSSPATPKNGSAINTANTITAKSESTMLASNPIKLGNVSKESLEDLDDETAEDLGNISDHGDVDEVGSEISVDDHDNVATVDRKTQPIVDVEGALAPLIFRRALHALLASLYVRHGNMAQIALTGLGTLLKDTDFFEGDLNGLPVPGTLTMLDLTVEAVCERFDNCLEGECDSILQFIRILTKHSGGKLSAFILQRLFRSLSFLCSYYSTRSNWIATGMPMPCSETGGDIPAFKVMRELIWAIVAQVETVPVANTLPDIQVDDFDYSTSSEAFALSRNFTLDFIEEVIDSVEVSRISEAAHLAISKQSSSTSSSSFWQQTSALAKRLFADQPLRSAFVALCAVCKLAWHGIRTSGGEPTPRDIGSKLLALEAVLEFCSCGGEKMRGSKVMGYQIRRLVIPCILNNMSHALVDNRVFSKVLRIISSIWKYWRIHCRIEFANLSEQLVIRILQAPTMKIRPVFQMIVLQEVVTWFDQPHLLLEMFVNFDMDRKFVSHWNVFSHLVKAVCAIARRTSVITGAWDWRPGGPAVEDGHKRTVSVRAVHMQALEEVSRIAKTLMDATGHAYLIIQDSNFRSRSLGNGAGWEEDDTPGSQAKTTTTSDLTDEDSGIASDSPNESPDANGGKKNLGVKFRRAVHQQSEALLTAAVKIYQEKDSLKKAVDYLVKNDFMNDSPQEIASFLRVYKNSFDPSAIGDFLGEGGKNPREEEYWKQIRFRYTRAVSFVELELEPALRLYLTGCGFRLPGEGQKVDRFVEVFVKAFWQDNSGTQYCPFRHPDTVHLVSYACIMLNTDLHRANADAKKPKKIKKMSKEDFLKQLRGCDQGSNIDQDYLSRIYDNIAAQPIELAVEASEAGGEEKTAAAGGGKGQTVESISIIEERAFVKEVSRGLRDSEDLLRSLSPFTYHFQVTGVDTNISLDLVSFMFECVWFHFHAITESLLAPTSGSPVHSGDIYVTFAALDILCYSLTSALFLDLKAERMALAQQLQQFKSFCESARGTIGRPIDDNKWFEHVQNSRLENAMETIAEVHTLIVKLKDRIQETANHEATRQVAARIEKKAKVLENNTFFVREGDMAKRNRSGRLDSYRFFLFSDHLIYAHQSFGEYKVHGQLSLSTMSVSDVDDPTSCSLYITHPTKSFVCVCESPTTKDDWLRDIQLTISSCTKRLTVNDRKLSILGRIEGQQEQMNKATRAVDGGRGFSTPSRTSLPPPPVATSKNQDTGRSSSSPLSTVPFVETGDGFKPKTSSPTENSSSKFSIAPPLPPPPSPSPEDRAAVQQENIRVFNEMVRGLSDKSLQSLFSAGLVFWKGMLESRGGGGVSEEAKVKMYGLYKQAKLGPFAVQNNPLAAAPTPSVTKASEPSSERIDIAWRSLGEMTQDEARREFLRSLYAVAPYWRYSQFI